MAARWTRRSEAGCYQDDGSWVSAGSQPVEGRDLGADNKKVWLGEM